MIGLRRGFVAACSIAIVAVVACGESRKSIGEECLRDDDCLSNICSDRACVSAPSLTTGGGTSPPSDEPRISDGNDAVAPVDAGDGG